MYFEVQTMKKYKWPGAAFLVVVLLAAILGCVSQRGGVSGTAPDLPAGDGSVWYYRAFGQSTDIRFHNNANGPGQDGINYAWINPGWIEQAASKVAAWSWSGVGGETESTADDDPGAAFVPTSADIAEALKKDVPLKLSDLGRDYKIVLESRGGKISNGHDGVTYFFTVLPTNKFYTLSVDITKLYSGPHPDNRSAAGNASSRNSQEGGGIMIRDALGAHRKDPAVDGYEELPAISNAVGTTFRNTDHASSLLKDGITSITNAINVPGASFKVGAENVAQAGVKTTYIIERRPDGFWWSIKAADGSVVLAPAQITSNWDLVQRVDKNKMYWGVYAARAARILVENITLTESPGSTDGLAFTTPPSTKTSTSASVSLRSRAAVTVSDYVLSVRADYAGRMVIYKGVASEANKIKDLQVQGRNEEMFVPVTLSTGANEFAYQFYPNDTGCDKDTVSGSFTVTYTEAPTPGTVYAAPASRGSGSGENASNAKAVAEAVAGAQPGQTIKLTAGDYSNVTIAFNADNSGVQGKIITVRPDDGVGNIKLRNIVLNGRFVRVYNFTAGGEPGNRWEGTPVRVDGDFNTVELVTAQWATGSGIQSSGGSVAGTSFDAWPKGNRYLNCTAFENKDAAGANSDGFQAQRVGSGTVYRGCVAYNNADDGWDFFTTVSTGPSAPILLENCIAFDHPANGFKLGGETQPADHILRDSLTFNNFMGGVSDNFNPGRLQVINVVSIDNGQNFILRDNSIIKPENEVKNSFSYRSEANRGKSNHYADAISGKVSDSFITGADGASKKGSRTLADADFVSLDRTNIAGVYTRDAQGSLVRGDYGKLK
jgi:hypothetical protein